MKIKFNLRKNIKFTFVIIITLLTGAICSSSTYVCYSNNYTAVLQYQKNKYGKTYGIRSDAIYHDGKEPDLIKAMGDDGKTIGYVLATDLNGFQPKNPKEAIEWQAKNKGYRIIPLYDVNGEKVIGTFTVGTRQ